MQLARLALSMSALSLVLLSGCDGAPEAGGSGEAKETKPSKKPMTELFPGSAPTLPPPLADLKFGASEANAEALLPGLTTALVDLDGYDGGVAAGSFSSKRGTSKVLLSLRLSVPTEGDALKTMLTEKWGAPKTQSELGKDIFTWYNPAEGLRVRLEDTVNPGKRDLEYSAYIPFATLIGSDSTKFGFETEPLLGLDLEGLDEHYGHVLETLTKEQAEKRRETMKAMFGDELGDRQTGTDLQLLPTELEPFVTTVWPTFDKDTRTIERIRFTIPFAGQEGFADELMATMKTAWGEPKVEERHGKTRWVFSEEPFIVVEDSIGRAWEIEKSAKRD